MSRAMWSGSISFGLVNIPVKLHVAIREKRIAFHMLHDQDHARLANKLVCTADGKEVHREHIVKGYEIAPDQYVIVQQSELDAVAPKESRTIDISDFVDLDDIDPLYFDKPYYLSPGERAAKAYRLLVEAMQQTKKAGIAKFVMRNKEYLAALRPVNGVICLCTMHFGDEVVPTRDITDIAHEIEPAERELKMATHLIESLTTKFDPQKYHDEYAKRVMEMIERKAEGQEVVTQPPIEEKPGRVVNLMAALEESLAEAKKQRGRKSSNGNGQHATARRRKSA
jgi:DNA end-binding protein Ku